MFLDLHRTTIRRSRHVSTSRWIALAACLLFVGCGSVASTDDAGAGDATPPIVDASGIAPDAATTPPDAAPPVKGGPPSTEVTASGAAVSGSTYTMRVQLGHAFSQAKVSGSTTTVEGASAIKP